MLFKFCDQQDMYPHQCVGTIHGGRKPPGIERKQRTRQDRFFRGCVKVQRINVAQNQSLAARSMGVSKGVKRPRMHEVGLFLCANTCLQSCSRSAALEALDMHQTRVSWHFFSGPLLRKQLLFPLPVGFRCCAAHPLVAAQDSPVLFTVARHPSPVTHQNDLGVWPPLRSCGCANSRKAN